VCYYKSIGIDKALCKSTIPASKDYRLKIKENFMSITIHGNAILPPPGTIPVLGKQGRLVQVPVTIQSRVNRATQAARLKKYLKNGFQWTLFQPILVAVFPDGTQWLLDGDHRKHMYVRAFPTDAFLPAYQIEVADEAEYHKLFVEINYKNRANANAEETFVHEVLARDLYAIKTAAQLTSAGLQVNGSPDAHGIVGDHSGPEVPVKAFRKAVKFAGLAAVIAAASFIKLAWPSDTKVKGELLQGLALLFKHYPVLSNGSKIEADFKKWAVDVAGLLKQSTLATDAKKEGGRVHTFAAESIARGLLVHYRKTTVRGGCNNSYKCRKLPTARVDALFPKK